MENNLMLLEKELRDNLKSISVMGYQPYVLANKIYDDFLKQKYPESRNLKERLYLLLKNIDTIPKCANTNCMNLANFLDNRYTTTCSKKCSVVYQKQTGVFAKKTDKRKNTSLQKYGCEFAIANKTIREKAAKTNFEKFGVNNPMQNKQIQDKQQNTLKHKTNSDWKNSNNKRKQTIMNKHNVDKIIDIPGVREKIIKTNIEKYGYSSSLQSPIIRNKIIETNLEKYGFSNPLQNELIKQQKQQTINEKYNVTNVFKSQPIKDKIKKTILEKYGTNYYSQSEKSKQETRKKFFSNLLKRNTNCLPLFSYDDYLTHNNLYKWQCKKCLNEFIDHMDNGHIPRCLHCDKKLANKSELEIVNFLLELSPNLKIERHNRTVIKPKELDIFLPDYNLAIEFNGVYWHSDLFKDKTYHIDKLNDCIDNKIKLIHIFEDDWIYKKDIVKARLQHAIGVHKVKIAARKTTVEKITSKVGRKFLEENHLMGAGNNLLYYGIFYNNKIVGVMSFSKNNLSRKVSCWEINRFATLNSYLIIGGGGKLFKKFVQDVKPDKVISYANRCWGEGNFYKNLDFTMVKYTVPNYWYVVGDKRKHRFSFRKSKFDDVCLTENQNRKQQGFLKIWDCGSVKWEWKNNPET